MKKISLFLFLIAFTGLECNKNSSGSCEQWVVEDFCVTTDPSILCDHTGTPREATVCGADLKLAQAGKLKLRSASQPGVALYTRYISKVP